MRLASARKSAAPAAIAYSRATGMLMIEVSNALGRGPLPCATVVHDLDSVTRVATSRTTHRSEGTRFDGASAARPSRTSVDFVPGLREESLHDDRRTCSPSATRTFFVLSLIEAPVVTADAERLQGAAAIVRIGLPGSPQLGRILPERCWRQCLDTESTAFSHARLAHCTSAEARKRRGRVSGEFRNSAAGGSRAADGAAASIELAGLCGAPPGRPAGVMRHYDRSFP